MEVKEYIASGILELYATGALLPEERAEVERMAELYPEVKAELDAIFQTIETYVKLHAVNPPAHLRGKILGQLAAPLTLTPDAERTTLPPGEAPVKPMYPSATAQPRAAWWGVAAAVLLLISAGLNIYFYRNWQNFENRYQTALATQNRYAQETQRVQQRLQSTAAELDVITQNQTQKLSLKGTEKSPSSAVTVYWNAATKEVFVKVAALPAPPAGRQYQLWALEDGKPIDAGMLNRETNATGLQRMKAINNAQAFAITLEPQGGSKNPTLEQMYVMGQI